MQVSFESLPLLVQTMNKALTDLCSEVQQLRALQPINEPPIDGKELMTRLAISEPTLIRLRKRNDIPYLEVLGQYRYVWSDVLAALAKKKFGKLSK